jgi:hypothetical protein
VRRQVPIYRDATPLWFSGLKDFTELEYRTTNPKRRRGLAALAAALQGVEQCVNDLVLSAKRAQCM